MKRSVIFLIFLFSCFSSFNGLSQEVGITLLNGFFQQQEQLISSSTYKGYKFGVSTQYLNTLPNSDVVFANIDLTSSISSWNKFNNEMLQAKGEVEVGYLPNINGVLYSGPTLKSTYQYDKYSVNYGYPFGFTAHTLNWGNLVRHQFTNGLQINLLISIPLVGLFSRPQNVVLREFKGDYNRPYFNKDLQFASLNVHRAVTTKLDISHRINDKLTFNVGYYADWLYHNQPKPLKSINHLLATGIKFRR